MNQPDPAPNNKTISPQKKSGFGFFTIVMIGGSIMALLIIGLLIREASSPEGHKFFRELSVGHRLSEQGRNAPGAKEIRNAGPCEQAFITNPKDFGKAAVEILDGGEGSIDTKETLVACVASLFTKPPACDDLARTYVDAAHPTGHFRVVVQQVGAKTAACNTAYDSRGVAEE